VDGIFYLSIVNNHHMKFIKVSDIKPKEMAPGFHGRFIRSENMTVAYWDIKSGSAIPVHHHVHEMIVNVISGKLQLTIDKETQILEAGMAAIIPSNVPHTAKGLTDCQVIDVFYPIREDYNS
jgi:quercetin dioxygenase-like cupin family protein